MTQRSRDRGFTLLEVLLSVAIVASIMTLVWGSFALTARSKQYGEQLGDRYHQLRLAMNRMAREISMAYLSKNDQIGTNNPRTMFVGQRNGSVDDLMFSAFAHMALKADAKECDQSLIRYYAAPDPVDRGKTNLMRRETRRLGVERPGEEGPAYVMLEDIKELHFEYYDDIGEEWEEEWDTRSASKQPDKLPDQVRIVVTLNDERGEEVTVRTATRTHVRDPLWFTSSSE